MRARPNAGVFGSPDICWGGAAVVHTEAAGDTVVAAVAHTEAAGAAHTEAAGAAHTEAAGAAHTEAAVAAHTEAAVAHTAGLMVVAERSACPSRY